MAERALRAIRELPETERPRERLAARGPGGLTAAELIALVWGSGSRGDERRGPRRRGAGTTRRTDRSRPGDRPRAPGDPGRRLGPGGPARGGVRARPAAHGGLAGRALDGPLAGRRRRPADPPDGPARARGAPGRDAQHEERRPPRRRPSTRATSARASSGSASCSARRSGSTPAGSSSSTTTRAAIRPRARTTSTSRPRRWPRAGCWTSTCSTTWSSATTRTSRCATVAWPSTGRAAPAGPEAPVRSPPAQGDGSHWRPVGGTNERYPMRARGAHCSVGCATCADPRAGRVRESS